MSTSYQNPSNPAPRVAEMPTISATELKNATADVFEQVAARRAVAITRHDKPRPVLLLEMKQGKITAPADLSGAPDWAKPIISAAIHLHTAANPSCSGGL